MSKSPLDSLGVTSQEAPAALQRLLDTQVISMVELEVALEHVRRQQPKSTRGFWIRSKLSRVVSGGEAVDVIDNDMPASTRVARRMKARENIRSQRFTLDDSISDTVPVLEKSHASVIFLTQALTNNESNVLFSSLSAYELQQLIGAMAPQEVAADTVIIEQGDLGDYFYVVEMGKVNFLVNGVLVGNCGPGASFGELALLYNAPRAATCKADSDCKLWKVDQYTFRFMLAKTQVSQNKHIHEILLKVPFLTDIGERALNKVNDALVTVNFKQGDRIFSKGQQGDTFYILDSGTVKVHDIGFGDTQFDDIELSSGAFFGERALLTGEPRAAHVTATSDCACLALSRESFEATLGPLQTLIDRAMTKRVMVSIPSFGPNYVTETELDRLFDSMTEVTFTKGEFIMEEGKRVKPALYFIKLGKVSVVSNKGEINNLQSGGHFGESTLTSKAKETAQATITSMEDNTRCHVLTKKAVESVIGSTSRLGQARSIITARDRPNVPFGNLKKLRILGMGTFGKVWLVVDTTNNKPFALKLMDKRECIEYGQHEGVIREKNILANIDHPFLLKMWGSYQNDKQLMMLLDLIQGGELFGVIHSSRGDGVSNDDAVFYAACILEGLGHLHERNIAYRDLKPENALIDADGYCIVVDYGFAKVVTDKTYTLCGTPEYLSPELILSKGHNKGVDYWALGVLIYECLVGVSPFYDHDQMRLFKKIVQGKFRYPSRSPVTRTADNLIRSLLQCKQSSRLGNLKGGHEDVKQHEWFRRIDLNKLSKRKIKAPWKPTIKDALDVSHFDDFSSAEKEVESSGPSLRQDEQSMFADFGEIV